jgi:hypothetical protein
MAIFWKMGIKILSEFQYFMDIISQHKTAQVLSTEKKVLPLVA